MAAKRVFFLSSGRLVAYQWQSGRIAAEAPEFPASEEGLTQFSAYLHAAPADPVYLLVDVVEEEFREENVPHARLAADRNASLRIKKSRLFRDSTYSHAIVQGRAAEGRRDDHVLFTALIRPDLLAPWLGQMARFKVPLSGIYSLPLLSALLIDKLKIADENALLVTLHSAGGLRQSFFQGQHLKVSRLAVSPDIGEARYCAYVLGEIEKIRRYLGSLRVLPRDVPLDVHIITEGAVLEELRRQATDSVTTRHHYHQTSEAARRLGLKGAAQTQNADRIFAHLLAKASPPNHYAPQRETRYFSLQRARTGMLAAGFALLALGVGVGGYEAIELINTKQETKIVTDQRIFYTSQLSKARDELPPAPALARDIETAVQVADKLRAYKAAPIKMMRALSEGLERFPEVRVDSIEWLATPDPDKPIGGRGGDRAQAQAVAQGLAADPAESGDQYHIAHVSGHIAPFAGDYREALGSVNRFADRLLKLESVQGVEAVSLPFNASSEQRLLGTAAGAASVGTASFVLRVVMKVHDGEQPG